MFFTGSRHRFIARGALPKPFASCRAFERCLGSVQAGMKSVLASSARSAQHHLQLYVLHWKAHNYNDDERWVFSLIEPSSGSRWVGICSSSVAAYIDPRAKSSYEGQPTITADRPNALYHVVRQKVSTALALAATARKMAAGPREASMRSAHGALAASPSCGSLQISLMKGIFYARYKVIGVVHIFRPGFTSHTSRSPCPCPTGRLYEHRITSIF
ncbi:hypothetical protein L917_16130 [Phytophthora nicotianae]|uniref:Uncharacterized protein n=1 Tax=Phytophthora nicotianae TaxID=4792 RepID=W2KFZ3_PHYNI|nr:hypothetical protein L917_16130 [Phytophthora nicotianae]